MARSRFLAALLCGTTALAMTAPAAVAQERNELIVQGVFTDKSSQTGFLSYRGLFSGTFDDGLFGRVDLMASRFSYTGGNGQRNTARVALMRSVSVGVGKVEFGGGLSFAEEKNTPASPGDFSRVGGFLGAMLNLEPAPGHTINLLAEYDSPDRQVFVRGYYEARFGDTGIGPVAHWVRNDGYRRYQVGLRVAHAFSPTSEVSLFATTGRERAGDAPRSNLSMVELGLRSRF